MFLIILVILVIIFLAKTIRIVPQTQHWVIERLGVYQKTWDEGIHILVPIIDRIVKKATYKEQVADFDPQSVITKDNVTISIDTVVYFKIFDAKLFVYGAVDPIVALDNLTATTLRNLIGAKELDETLTSRDEINVKMQAILDEATDSWGIKVKRVELKNIVTPREIQESMEKQMKAEREKRRTVLEAEAHQESVTKRAEGDAKAVILKANAQKEAAIAEATGRAEGIRLVYEAEAEGLQRLRDAGIDNNVLRLKSLETYKALGDGRATKIIVPADFTDMATKLTMAGEVMGIGDAEPIDKSPKTLHDDYSDPCCDDDDRSDVTKEMVEDDSEEFVEDDSEKFEESFDD